MKLALLLFLLNSCAADTTQKTDDKAKIGDQLVHHLYSPEIRDSFKITVSLPLSYNENKTGYPLVYLLDANFHFDILKNAFHRYEEGGLMPPVILVGIGYKDFATMDSLRYRDFSYPKAIPEYEMELSGGADKFLNFISAKLVPKMDALYRSDSKQRILMGHSLGGYFVLFALNENIRQRKKDFSSYIAISPSAHYNHNYILNQLDSAGVADDLHVKVYSAFGGNEDAETEPGELKGKEILARLEKPLSRHQGIKFKSVTFSELEHMDTGFPGFTTGLNWALANQEKD